MRHPVIVSSLAQTQERGALQNPFFGRSAFASALIQPLRRRLDYQSIARQVFTVEQLPSGALPCYEYDPFPTSPKTGFQHDQIVIHSRRKTERKALRVTVPQFEIFSSPTIKITDIKNRFRGFK